MTFTTSSFVRSMCTVSQLRTKWNSIFIKNKVSEPSSSIDIILSHILQTKQLSYLDKIHDLTVDDHQIKDLNFMCKERIKGKPVQYIIGEWDFCDLTLKMKPPVFIPRSETEDLATIVKNQINNMDRAPTRILDVCCGTGCISLALASAFESVKCVAVDCNPAAIELTKCNSELLSLNEQMEVIEDRLQNGQISKLIDRKFDIIVSNPPYIPTSEIDELQIEIVNHEDIRALDGGLDGLNVVRDLIKFSNTNLVKGGYLYIEVGDGQFSEVSKHIANIKASSKINDYYLHQDFMKKPRFFEILF